MLRLRALRHPLTPLVLVLVVLPLAILLAPPQLRGGFTLLLLVLGSPAAAIAAVRALPGALARIPVPDGSEPGAREAALARGVRWFLSLAPTFGTAAILVLVNGVRAWRVSPAADDGGLTTFQSLLLATIPLFFVALGVRLWRDLAAARARRSQGLAPTAPERPSATGDEGLDRRLGARARTSYVVGILTVLATALANALPPYPKDPDALPWAVRKLAALPEAIRDGEPYRFLTAALVHGEIAALAVGLLSFAAVAPLAEAYVGGFWLVVAYAGGSFVAAVASWTHGAPYMGMTGGAAALAGLLLVVGVLQRSRLPPAALRRLAVRVGVVAVVLAFASALLPNAGPAAHLGGFTFGMVLSLFTRPSPAAREAMEKARAEALGSRERRSATE